MLTEWALSALVVSNAGHLTSALFDDLVHVRAVVEAFRRARVVRSGDRARRDALRTDELQTPLP